MLVVSVLQPLFESEAWLIVVVSMEMESNLFASRLTSKKEAELTIESHPRTSSVKRRNHREQDTSCPSHFHKERKTPRSKIVRYLLLAVESSD